MKIKQLRDEFLQRGNDISYIATKEDNCEDDSEYRDDEN